MTERVSAVAVEVLVGMGISEAVGLKQLAQGTIHIPRGATDANVIALAENCTGLKEMNLNHCFNITNAAVIALAENCAGLTHINLRHCFNITDAAVIALAERCAGLTQIRFGFCRNITDDAIVALAENCEYVEDIDCDDTQVSATGHQLAQEVKDRPKPPPLPEGWWFECDDYPGPNPCKGMMN